jgi:hypothetical protein
MLLFGCCSAFFMDRVDTDIELLTSAFAYSFALLNEVFYLRKRDLKVVAVYMTDYALVSECRDTYESGLTKEEERDIKEAIIAQEKKYDTHILIPRLTKEERFKIIEQFIQSTPDFSQQLQENYRELVRSTEKYGLEFYKKGIAAGVEMEFLTSGIDNEKVKSDWTAFYRTKTKVKALNWLDEQKNALQHHI